MRRMSILAAGLALVGCAGPGLGGASSREQAQGGADVYYAELVRLLDRVEGDVPALTRSADRVAALAVAEPRFGLAVVGKASFVWELVGRSGGIMCVLHLPDARRYPEWRGAVLYCLEPGQRARDCDAIAAFRKRGLHVVVFGSAPLLAAAREAGMECADTVTVPTAPHDGVFEAPGGTWLVPTYDLGVMAASWAWAGELVAACTRRGRMLVMFQSIRKPTGRERMEKHRTREFLTRDHGRMLPGQYRKFHAGKPTAVGEGKLAAAWLAALRKHLDGLMAADRKHIQAAAAMAVRAHRAGGTLGVLSTGHAPPHVHGVPGDPPYWVDLGRRGGKSQAPALDRKGFAVGIGYDSTFADEGTRRRGDVVRQSGARAAWIAATYQRRLGRPEWLKAGPQDVLIDAQWAYGDAAVDVPGYDIPVLPPSGFLAAGIYRMIQAEVHVGLAERAWQKRK